MAASKFPSQYEEVKKHIKKKKNCNIIVCLNVWKEQLGINNS